jgi:integrase
MADLKALEDHYIRPYYQERAKKYKEIYGKKCPPSILFLNKFGKPIDPSMVSSRTFDAKQKAMDSNLCFREGVTFYDARHWWPTMFMLKFFKDKILTESADVLYAAVGEVVRNQMGHEEIDTTYNFYIDKARLLALAHEGYVNELVTDPDECVEEFIARTSTPNLKTLAEIQ